MKMLIIDDSKAMRTFLTFIVQEMSCATIEAGDGREALDLLVHNDPREPFDVALVDWEMPRMNGLEFVEAVRRNRQELFQIRRAQADNLGGGGLGHNGSHG